ncbi:MAG: ABC transporter substrate-binding protein [Erysipelotrichaceae bacterium]|nr:ABC transporter substrate-binding protein [Erysipelotrichaceae bacterium]
MKKLVKALLAAGLAASLVACGSSSSDTGSDASEKDDKVIKVGATPVPHAQILNEVVKDKLAEDGWTLEVVEFNDYVLPNTSLEEGEIDANYYQTLGYMNGENESRGLHLVAVKGVHIEPMGIYSEKYEKLEDIPEGAEIAVPNDEDNRDRAVQFLISQGFLEETDDYSAAAINDNAEVNPKGYKITELEAATLPRALSDVDAAVINGNYALEADLPASHPALAIEEFDDETSVLRTNFLVVKEGTEDSEKIQALIKAITSDEVQKYIDDTYKGAVITSFIDPE